MRAEDDPPPWRPANYGAALCEEIERFFEAVEKHVPDREAAFVFNARGDARDRRKPFEKHAGT
jgi:hypothetical protein